MLDKVGRTTHGWEVIFFSKSPYDLVGCSRDSIPTTSHVKKRGIFNSGFDCSLNRWDR